MNITETGRTVRLGDVTEQPRLPLAPNTPFLLTHSPLSWFSAKVDGQPRWLPVLKPMALAGGVLGSKPGRGKDDPPQHGPAVDRMRRRKVPRVVLEAEVSEYLRAYPCASKDGRKGDYYCDAWERPEVVAGAYDPGRDDEGYHRWLVSLLDRGLIQAPHPRILERLMERQSGHVERLQSLQQTPGIVAKVIAEQNLVETARAASKPAEKAANG